MKKVGEVSLGIVTGVGGYLDISSLVTSTQAGAVFQYQLVWAVMVGGLCAAILCEQGGRLAAVSGKTVSDAIRERFGFPYHLTLYAIIALVTLLILAIEIGGASVAIEFATGIAFGWWAVPVVLSCWLILWKGSYGFVQYGVASASLITICFVVGAVLLQPHWLDVARGLVPSLPQHDRAKYWFLAAVIVAASITPSLVLFYSSGAVEDRWDAGHLVVNRVAAFVGLGFGSLIAAAVVVVAAMALLPNGIRQEHYAQLALLLIDAMGWWGFVLLTLSVAIACVGTAVEVALVIAYMTAQGFGWEGSQDAAPRDNARFAAVYTGALCLGAVPVLVGIEPIKLTTVSMALTALTLPIAVVPFLFVMNDPTYLKEHTNGWLANLVVTVIIGMTFVLAVVTVPLMLFGG